MNLIFLSRFKLLFPKVRVIRHFGFESLIPLGYSGDFDPLVIAWCHLLLRNSKAGNVVVKTVEHGLKGNKFILIHDYKLQF